MEQVHFKISLEEKKYLHMHYLRVDDGIPE